MRSGRLVFPRLTSYHLPVTLFPEALWYWNAAPINSARPRIAMRSLTWVSDKHLTGWACSVEKRDAAQKCAAGSKQVRYRSC